MEIGQVYIIPQYWGIFAYPTGFSPTFGGDFDFHIQVVGTSFTGRTARTADLYYTVSNHLDREVKFQRVSISVWA